MRKKEKKMLILMTKRKKSGDEDFKGDENKEFNEEQLETI